MKTPSSQYERYDYRRIRVCLRPCQARAGRPARAPTVVPRRAATAKRVPRGWVHGRVPISLKAGVAAGITGKVLTASGHALASASESRVDMLGFRVQRSTSDRTGPPAYERSST